MATVKMRVAASDHGAEIFQRGAFDGQIGKTVPVGAPVGGSGRLVAAEIVDDGQVAVLTLECDASTSRRLAGHDWGDYSFGFGPREGVTLTPIPAVDAASKELSFDAGLQ